MFGPEYNKEILQSFKYFSGGNNFINLSDM
jgi:hypothetical protein